MTRRDGRDDEPETRYNAKEPAVNHTVNNLPVFSVTYTQGVDQGMVEGFIASLRNQGRLSYNVVRELTEESGFKVSAIPAVRNGKQGLQLRFTV